MSSLIELLEKIQPQHSAQILECLENSLYELFVSPNTPKDLQEYLADWLYQRGDIMTV